MEMPSGDQAGDGNSTIRDNGYSCLDCQGVEHIQNPRENLISSTVLRCFKVDLSLLRVLLIPH